VPALLAISLIALLLTGACRPRSGGEDESAGEGGRVFLAERMSADSLYLEGGKEPVVAREIIFEAGLPVETGKDIENVRLERGELAFRTGPFGDAARGDWEAWVDVPVDVDASAANLLYLELSRATGHIRPRVLWESEVEGEIRPASAGGRGKPLEVVQGTERGGFVTFKLELDRHPGWKGHVRSIRVWSTNLPRNEVRIRRLTLLDDPPVAQWKVAQGTDERTGKIEVANETRSAVFAAPPLRLVAPVRLPEGARLDLGIALLEPSWFRAGSGARFTVSLERDGEAFPLFERELDPFAREADRGWRDANLDLAEHAGRDVTIVLETTALDPGSRAVPLAVWSDPFVYRPGLRPGERNVVLVSLDTLRADHLGAYGYPRATSPALDRFARESFFFRDLVSQAASTGPSHMSLFLSLYPTAHGITNHDRKLIGEAQTLARIFRKAGYDTGAFTEGGYISASLGFHQGFSTYAEVEGPMEGRGGYADVTFPRAVEWLRRHADRPFLLFVQSYQVHVPYCPGDPFVDFYSEGYEGPLDRCLGYRELAEVNYDAIGLELSRENHGKRPATPEDLQYIEDLYDAEIRRLDSWFGTLLREIEALDLASDTLVFAFSDHGEDFRDHLAMARHARSLYNEMVHVLGALRIPGRCGRTIAEPVAMVDFLPTLLELAGIDPTGEPIEGQSLVPLLEQNLPQERTIFSENYSLAIRASARRGRYKLIHTRAYEDEEKVANLDERSRRIRGLLGKGYELYDLEEDPGEKHDLLARGELSPQARRAFDTLRDELARWLVEQEAKQRASATRETSSAEEARLRELGYLDDPDATEGDPEPAPRQGDPQPNDAEEGASANRPG